MTILTWMLWGAAGAFGYAAPRLLAAVFDPPKEERRPVRGLAEFLVAVAMGVIAGAGIAPWLASSMGWKTDVECRALAILVGVCVNPVAPAAVQLMTNMALARLGHPLARKPR